MKEKVFAQLYSIVRQEREGHLENLPAHSCDFSRELAGLYLYYLILCLRLFAHPISSVTTGKFLTHPCLQARYRRGIVFHKPIKENICSKNDDISVSI